MCDFLSHTYRTQCRFLRDSDIVGEIRWYEADPRAPDFEGWQAIGSTYWDIHDGYQSPVGELIDAEKITTLQKAWPGALGAHQCGTEEDFAEGGLYLTSPPVLYTSSGLPVCCDPARVGTGGIGFGGKSSVAIIPPVRVHGGVGFGGRASVERVYPPDSTLGGGEGGGSAGDHTTTTDALMGGGEGGGTVGDVYTGGAGPPGATCGTAGPILPGQSYSGPIGAGALDWFAFTSVPGTHYTITVAASGAGVCSTSATQGTCFLSILVAGPIIDTGVAGWTSGGTHTMLSVLGTGGGSYTLTLTSP